MADFDDVDAACRGFATRGRGDCAGAVDGDAGAVDAAGAAAASAAVEAAAGASVLPAVGEGDGAAAGAGFGAGASVAAGAFALCAHTEDIGSRPAEAAIPISGAKRKLAVLRIVITHPVDMP